MLYTVDVLYPFLITLPIVSLLAKRVIFLYLYGKRYSADAGILYNKSSMLGLLISEDRYFAYPYPFKMIQIVHIWFLPINLGTQRQYWPLYNCHYLITYIIT